MFHKGKLFFFLFSFPVFPWGSHYLITYYALSQVKASERKVRVESLEEFLQKIPKKKLFTFLQRYYLLLQEKGYSIPSYYLEGRYSLDSTKDFLFLLRLNPQSSFFYAVRLLPGEGNFSSFSFNPSLEKEKSQGVYVAFRKVSLGEKVSVREILATYADEPDWYIDFSLWDRKEYGYPPQPYGKEEGESSKAPFHMLFWHENFLTRIFAPEITGGFLVERVRLFWILSLFALKEGHPYWGYRFLAWVLHYVQDISQPYHVKSVPFMGVKEYIKWLFASSKERGHLKKAWTQLVANRHFLYEDFVVYLLGGLGEKPLCKICQEALKKDLSYFYPGGSLEEFIWRVSLISSIQANALDKILSYLLPSKYVLDPSFDVEKEYTKQEVKKVFPTNWRRKKEFVRILFQNLKLTGWATRYVFFLTKTKRIENLLWE